MGRPEPALHHAGRCLEICEQHHLGGFDHAYAYEALARAQGLAGDAETAARWRAQAREAADGIEDAEDRELVFGDLGTLPG